MYRSPFIFTFFTASALLTACAADTKIATSQAAPVPGSTGTIGTNLLANPSFEEPLNGESLQTGLPGWGFGFYGDQPPLTKSEAMLMEDPAQAHSGRKFIRLRAGDRYFNMRSPLRPQGYEPGLYEVSVWAKGTIKSTVGFSLAALNANLGYGFSGLTTEWQKYSMTVYSPGVGTDFPWKDQTQFGFHVKGSPEIAGDDYIDLDDATIIRLNVGLADTFGDHMVLQRDRPLPIWGWAKNAGQKVTVGFNGQTQTATAGQDGRWRVTLQPVKAGGPYTIDLDGRAVAFDVMVGDVWICSGQSNMEFGLNHVNGYYNQAPEVVGKADKPMIRLWQAAKQFSDTPMGSYQQRQDSGPDFYQATWNVCSPRTVVRGVWGGFSAVGYFFGRDIQESQKVPVGLMMIANGGTAIESFISPEALKSIAGEKLAIPPYTPQWREDQKIPALPRVPDNIEAPTAAYANVVARVADREAARKSPSGQSMQVTSAAYNSLVSPVFPMAVKGVIWYQGEHNGGDTNYAIKLKTLIADWRARLGQKDLPFMVVQLPFWRTNPVPHWERVREAQLQVAQSDPKVGLAVALDLADKEGDAYGMGEIHPKNKEDVGKRLALAARAVAYGEKVVTSPVFRGMKVDGAKATVSFDSVGDGLEAHGDKLVGFEIAGSDKKFVKADAEIVGNTVVVSAADVAAPVAVRYGFVQAALPVPNLYNKNGLPASPFRTDDWPLD